jgi:hypothetical protein
VNVWSMPVPLDTTCIHGVIKFVRPPALLAVAVLLKLERTSVCALAPRLAGAGALAYSMVTGVPPLRWTPWV